MNGAAGAQPRVAVLMATFEDARFLPEQLASIRSQDHGNLELWVSRDCDEEEIRNVLDEHASAFGAGRFFVLPGPRRGCAANFLSLVHNPDIRADHFAYSDQDDVWERDKLARAVAALERVPDSVPALYGSRSRLIDVNGRERGLSRFAPEGRPLGFRNALAENAVNGHTLVMNRAARDLMRSSGITDAPFHDWWTYLLVAGAGGRIICDPRPTVRYRLHDRNAVGKLGRRDRLTARIKRAVDGEIRRVGDRNVEALWTAEHLLTPESRRVLEVYSEARKRGLPGRLWGLWRSGVRSRTLARTLLILAAVVFNRL